MGLQLNGQGVPDGISEEPALPVLIATSYRDGEGLAWKKISRELGVGVSTVLRIAQEARKSGSENPKGGWREAWLPFGCRRLRAGI
jgi:hypothetical protein